jgi:hypothetical protein
MDVVDALFIKEVCKELEIITHSSNIRAFKEGMNDLQKGADETLKEFAEKYGKDAFTF